MKTKQDFLLSMLDTLKNLILMLIISIGIITFFAAIFIYASDYIYNINHPIPNPTERGEDLGLGLIVIACAICSLFISIPFSLFINVYIFKKFLKKSNNKG